MAADFVLKASLEKVWTEETVLSSLVEQSKANKTSHYLGNRVPAVKNSKPQYSILMQWPEIVGSN